MKPKRILCPVDYSRPSEEAVRFAGAWARRAGSELLVLNVDHLEVASFVTPALALEMVAGLRRERQSAARSLEEFTLRHLGDGVNARYMVRQGDSADCILEVLRGVRAGAIVMGTHARVGKEAARMGSVTESVVALAGVPVLVVHDQHRERAASAMAKGKLGFKKIVLPDDGQSMRQRLEAAVKQFSAKTAHLRAVSTPGWGEDEAPFRLLETAKKFSAELVAVLNKKRGGLDLSTRETLRGAPCPVLVLPE